MSTEKGSVNLDSSKHKFKPSDFEFGALLGEGAYARVFHAILKETGEAFAIKMLDKMFIRRHGKEHFVLNERTVLSMIDHPNLMKLFFTFQDSTSLYFVLELAPGGELFQQIKKMGGCSMEVVQFYFAEIVCAIEYLHGKNVIHRDLKPENILISSNGHIILTDFGTAKIVSQIEQKEERPQEEDEWARPVKKNSFVGTAEYVSPEVLNNSSAGFAVDMWALGCILYTLIAGRPPFRGGSEYLTFQKILKREFSFTSAFTEESRDLVNQLLQMDPSKRIGCRSQGFDELKAHRFFRTVNFDRLFDQESPAFDVALQEHPSVLTHIDSDEDFASIVDAKSISRNSVHSSDCIWEKFIKKGEESIVKMGLVGKRRGMFTKQRQLILTSKPRFVYIDKRKMKKKGEIEWSDGLWGEIRDDSIFYIHTPRRKYYMTALDCKAVEWIDAIDTFRNTL